MFFRKSVSPLTHDDRLSTSNFTDLIDSYRENLGKERLTLYVKSPSKTKDLEEKNNPIAINYFIHEIPTKNKNATLTSQSITKVAVFYMSRDQKDVRAELDYLPLTQEVISSYCAQYSDSSSHILLLPSYQCGAYLGIDKLPYADAILQRVPLLRDHAIFVEVDLQQKKISLTDSQAWLNGALYFHNINVPGFETIYKSLGRQQDSNLCGYYVHLYMIAYLHSGDITQLETIEIDPSKIKKDIYLIHWKEIADQIIFGKEPTQSLPYISKELVHVSDPAEDEEWSLVEPEAKEENFQLKNS